MGLVARKIWGMRHPLVFIKLRSVFVMLFRELYNGILRDGAAQSATHRFEQINLSSVASRHKWYRWRFLAPGRLRALLLRRERAVTCGKLEMPT